MSQLVYDILMAYEERSANILHYGSSQCRRATRSVMAAIVHAFIHAVDMGVIVPDTLNELLDGSADIEAFVDSRLLFRGVTKNSNTAVRRLQIDKFVLRKSYKNGELRCIVWINGGKNPADLLTKEM